MTKELMELADEYAVLRQLTDECASSARAVLKSAIESLQAENKRLKREIQNQYRCIESHAEITQKAEAERDALAAKLETAIQSSAHWQHQFTDMQAKLVTLEADAERYRLLREQIYIDEERRLRIARVYLFLAEGKTLQERLDAAIDAAKGVQHEDA